MEYKIGNCINFEYNIDNGSTHNGLKGGNKTMKYTDREYEEAMMYMVGDTMRAKVQFPTSNGVFLVLESGDKAYATFGGLSAGDNCVVSVLKAPTERFPMFLVGVDSTELRAA